MKNRNTRKLLSTLTLLEHQVVELISDRREDAGAAALRAMDRDNQEAAVDRELAMSLAGQANGAWEVLELIRACYAIHDAPKSFNYPQTAGSRRQA